MGNRIKIIDFGLARRYDSTKKLQVCGLNEVFRDRFGSISMCVWWPLVCLGAVWDARIRCSGDRQFWTDRLRHGHVVRRGHLLCSVRAGKIFFFYYYLPIFKYYIFYEDPLIIWTGLIMDIRWCGHLHDITIHLSPWTFTFIWFYIYITRKKNAPIKFLFYRNFSSFNVKS